MRRKVPNGKETFYQDLEPFFSSGILTELYMSDRICICDLGHFAYIFFLYLNDPRYDSQIGFLGSLKAVKLTLRRGDEAFFKALRHCSRQFVIDRSIVFNDKALALARKQVEKMEATGIPGSVDLELNRKMRQLFLAGVRGE